MKSYLICIINSCSVIGRAPILLQALPYSNSTLPSLLLASSPWNPPSLLLLPPPISFPLSKCRQISTSTWLHPPTHNALGAATGFRCGRQCLCRGLLCSSLSYSPLSYRLTRSSRWLPLLRQHLDVVAMATSLTPPPLPLSSLYTHTHTLSLPLKQIQRLYPSYSPSPSLKLFFSARLGAFPSSLTWILLVAPRLPRCMYDSSDDDTVRWVCMVN